MRFLKTFLFLILWVGIPSVSFADVDLWGDDSEQGSSNAGNDLWETPAPEAKPVEKAPAAKPAAKPQAKPVAKPVEKPVTKPKPAEQPVAQPVTQPVAQPVAEPAPEPIIRRGDPLPQQNHLSYLRRIERTVSYKAHPSESALPPPQYLPQLLPVWSGSQRI